MFQSGTDYLELENQLKAEEVVLGKGVGVMDKPLVSIVTPCYNGEQYLDRFFYSILNQTYPNLELVFINDGSTDRTEEVVNSFRGALETKGVRFIYRYQENAGQAAALNCGLKLFTGEYLTWPDSDDEISPEFIEKMVAFLEMHPEEVYCAGKAVSVQEEDPSTATVVREKRKRTGRLTFFEDILFVRNVFFPGYLVKTAAVDVAIPKREIYTGTGGQNAQILLPLAWHYGEPGYVEDSIYKYYIRKNSHSHSLNTSELIICQLHNYENILVATLKRITEENVQTYIPTVRRHYAKLRFGNAVDTMRADLIRKYYLEMKELHIVTMHDFALYVKYTNRFIRRVFRIG